MKFVLGQGRKFDQDCVSIEGTGAFGGGWGFRGNRQLKKRGKRVCPSFSQSKC